ncbi:MAG: DUF6603 domain-containing protein, partial [Nodosilinea sp.]
NVDLSIRDLGLVWCSAHLSQDEDARSRFNQAFAGVELLSPITNEDGTVLDPLLVGGLFKATLTVPSVDNPIPLQLPFRSQRPAPRPAEPKRISDDLPPQKRSRQSGDASAAPASAEADTPTTSVAITTGADTGPAKWFEVNKTIGPLSLRRLGLAYADQRVWFLFDTSLNAGAVALIVDGLGAGLNPFDLLGGRFEPAFTLRGLGLVIKGPAEVSGAFLRDRISDPRGDYDEFSGVILVKTASLTISGMGSYADPPWGDPSLFAYAFLDKPIGGPSFFFVTGLALGIAVNRNLDLPPIDQISQFPLVRLALGDDLFSHQTNRPKIRDANGDAELAQLLEVQQAMKPYTRPSDGQVALAVGVRFTTFQMLNSFALLVASFGKPFKLDLLVSSRLQVPALPEEGTKNKSAKKKKSSAKEPLLAQVGIDLRGTWIPEEGFLIVEGRITEGSWFLDSACQLSGGAAFAAWTSGPHNGDFVMTVGGYHPKFQVPAHYPQVPRLAFNFTSGPIEIKGDAYFAMTPSALMTGGSLSATFAEGKFRAWFNCGADFLVAWEPFAYDATMFIEVGASYRTALGTIGASVGASLHLWGPDLAGVATVDLRVVKFDIHFGSSKNKPPAPISAEMFKERFLPADKKDLLSIGVSDGLVRDGLVRTDTDTDTDRKTIPLFIVNPTDFTLVIESVIPQQDKVPLGIGPMGVPAEPLDKKQAQIIKYKICDISQTPSAPITNFTQTPILKPVPAALWGPADEDGKVRSLRYDTKDTVIPAIVGYQLKPPPPPPPREDALAKYSVSHFLFSTDAWEDNLGLGRFETIEKLPTKGKSLVIIAQIKNDLHIRIFDAGGKLVIDKAKSQFITGSDLTTLKLTVEPFMAQPENPSSATEKRNLIHLAKIVASAAAVPNYNGGRKNPTWPITQAFWKPDKTTQPNSSEQSEKVMTPQDLNEIGGLSAISLFAALTGTPATEQDFKPEISLSSGWLDDLQEKPSLGTLSEVTP